MKYCIGISYRVYRHRVREFISTVAVVNKAELINLGCKEQE